MRFDFLKTGLAWTLLSVRCFAQDPAANPASQDALPAAPFAAAPVTPRTPKPMAEQPMVAFEQVGASFGQSVRIGDLGWTDEQFNAFLAGLADGYHHRHEPFDQKGQDLYAAMSARIQELDRKKLETQFEDPKYLEKFIRDTRRMLNMQQTDSGLCYMVQGVGGSTRPTPNDTVIISFDVTAADLQTPLPPLSGSRKRVKVSELMPGLSEGVQMMTADSKGVFLLTPSLSYGAGPWPACVIKNSPLIFRITLHEIEAAGTPTS